MISVSACLLCLCAARVPHSSKPIPNTHTSTTSKQNHLRSYSYRANIPLDALVETLAFDTTEKGLEWLEPFGLTFVDASRTIIDCKTSSTVVQIA